MQCPAAESRFPGFRFEVIESRNDIRLTAEPSRRNHFGGDCAYRDTSGGEGRYHFRLTWAMSGGGNVALPPAVTTISSARWGRRGLVGTIR